MVPVISFVGYHNSGKTTFATKVVKELKQKGHSVAVLKSAKQRNLIEDKPGKDSYRYREAGADAVGIVTPDELALFKKIGKPDLQLLAFSLFDDYDIVICEGFKDSNVPKIEVTRKEANQPLLLGQVKNIVAVVSDYHVDGTKNFSINDVSKIIPFIEETFIKRREDLFPDEVEVFINDKRVPVKHYVKETLEGVLFGFLKPLKGIKYPIEKMDVRIVVGKGKKT